MSVQSLAEKKNVGKQENMMKNACKSVQFRYIMQDNLIVKFRIPCFIAALYKPFNTSKTSDFLSIHFTSQQK